MRARWQRYGPGEEPHQLATGYFLLTHGSSFYARLVRIGQRLRFRGARRPFAHWSHAALVLDADGRIAEARGQGVVEGTIEKYRDVEYPVEIDTG